MTRRKKPSKKIGKAKKTTKAKKIGSHYDTNSHNYTFHISGTDSYNDVEKILHEIEFWQKQLDKLRAEYRSERGKMYKASIMADIRMAKKWIQTRKKNLLQVVKKIKS